MIYPWAKNISLRPKYVFLYGISCIIWNIYLLKTWLFVKTLNTFIKKDFHLPKTHLPKQEEVPWTHLLSKQEERPENSPENLCCLLLWPQLAEKPHLSQTPWTSCCCSLPKREEMPEKDEGNWAHYQWLCIALEKPVHKNNLKTAKKTNKHNLWK